MNARSGRTYAVITGDVIRSSRLSSAEFKKVQTGIQRATREMASHFPECVPLPVELFRGDSWQLLVSDPSHALRIGLYVRAHLLAEEKGADTRFAIGVGKVDTQPKSRVGQGRGEAFRLSGELMDRKSTSRMRFGAPAGPPEAAWRERSIAAMLVVLDVVVSGWTSAQAHAVRGALLDWKQERIAERWTGGPISQQAAGQHLSRAGWDGVREALAYFEETLKGWPAR